MVAYSHKEIDELVLHAQAGDKEAIASIYEQYVDRVYRLVATRIADEADAEDITAEVFVQMLNNKTGYDSTLGSFQAWLYGIAKECIAKHEATIQQDTQVDSVLQAMFDKSEAPESQILKEEQLRNLRLAMRELSADEHTILILRFVEGKSHEEVAEIMGKSTSATRIMQFRALKNLAKQLELEKKRHYLRPSKSDGDR